VSLAIGSILPLLLSLRIGELTSCLSSCLSFRRITSLALYPSMSSSRPPPRLAALPPSPARKTTTDLLPREPSRSASLSTRSNSPRSTARPARRARARPRGGPCSEGVRLIPFPCLRPPRMSFALPYFVLTSFFCAGRYRLLVGVVAYLSLPYLPLLPFGLTDLVSLSSNRDGHFVFASKVETRA
jgi:hypothetical protein